MRAKTDAVFQAIEVRSGPQGVKAKWVRIELRKIETLPGGGVANTFFDFVGQSPINLWQSPNDEFSPLTTVSTSIQRDPYPCNETATSRMTSPSSSVFPSPSLPLCRWRKAVRPFVLLRWASCSPVTIRSRHQVRAYRFGVYPRQERVPPSRKTDH